MTVEISKDVNIGEDDERREQGSQIRNAVPSPTFEEVSEEDTGRGVLMRENPEGMESKSSAEVVLGEIQVSVRAKRWIRDISASQLEQ